MEHAEVLRHRAALQAQARARAEQEQVRRRRGLPMPQWPPGGPRTTPQAARLAEPANRQEQLDGR
jgi:hypothetical protein